MVFFVWKTMLKNESKAVVTATADYPSSLEPNVAEYLRKMAKRAGEVEAGRFEMMAGLDAQFCCKSPIERLLVIAFEFMKYVDHVDVIKARDVDDVLNYEPPPYYPNGVVYLPQAPIEGNYIADFVVRGRGICQEADIAVELDGHAFHDRDQTQRSYEKRRDREFQKIGLRVFRYTGADVVRDPLAIVTEIFKSLKAI